MMSIELAARKIFRWGEVEEMNPVESIAAPAWTTGLKSISVKCAVCTRSMALRQLSARKAGIRMRDAWYCSSSCFASVAEKEFSALLKLGVEQGSHVVRMPLGLVLISRGLLTSAQLREANEELKEVGGEIGELLVRRGAVTERQVTSVRAAQWGCAVFTMPKQLEPTRIHIPMAFIKACSAIPLHYVGARKLLLVGFVQAVEYGLLYAIEQMTGCKTQPCFVTPSEFRTLIESHEDSLKQVESSPASEVIFETMQPPEEMARILCGYGVELEAEEAMIAKCKEYLWARLTSGTREVNLLFKAG
jgi:Type II secretion system (T2SS), protein E, N-terminal domain